MFVGVSVVVIGDVVFIDTITGRAATLMTIELCVLSNGVGANKCQKEQAVIGRRRVARRQRRTNELVLHKTHMTGWRESRR